MPPSTIAGAITAVAAALLPRLTRAACLAAGKATPLASCALSNFLYVVCARVLKASPVALVVPTLSSLPKPIPNNRLGSWRPALK